MTTPVTATVAEPVRDERPPQCTFRCDGCGATAPGEFGRGSLGWHKPGHWYMRSDDNGPQIACSRKCIDIASKAAGTSPVVLPI